jgi:hypothetical protein
VVKNSAGRGRGFPVGPERTHRLTLNSSATLVARLRLHESSISARFKFSPKIQTVVTFDFCNSIPSRTDIRQGSGNVRFVPGIRSGRVRFDINNGDFGRRDWGRSYLPMSFDRRSTRCIQGLSGGLAELCWVAEQIRELTGGPGLADQKPLCLRAPFQPKLLQLLDSFDSFGSCGDAERDAESSHSRCRNRPSRCERRGRAVG